MIKIQIKLNSSDNSTHNSSYLLPDVAGSLTFLNKDFVNCLASVKTSPEVLAQVALGDGLDANCLKTVLKPSVKGKYLTLRQLPTWRSVRHFADQPKDANGSLLIMKEIHFVIFFETA